MKVSIMTTYIERQRRTAELVKHREKTNKVRAVIEWQPKWRPRKMSKKIWKCGSLKDLKRLEVIDWKKRVLQDRKHQKALSVGG